MVRLAPIPLFYSCNFILIFYKEYQSAGTWLTLPLFVALIIINIIFIIVIVVLTTFALRMKKSRKKSQADSTYNKTAYGTSCYELKNKNSENDGKATAHYQNSPITEQSSSGHYQSLEQATRSQVGIVKLSASVHAVKLRGAFKNNAGAHIKTRLIYKH